MFFKKKKKVAEFNRNMTTEEANQHIEKSAREMPAEAVALIDFFTYAEKVSMGVNHIGGSVEVARRMSEPKTKVVLLVIDMLRGAKIGQIDPNRENADIAQMTWEELRKHMSIDEYTKFDELYISAIEHGETFLQKSM